MTDAERRRAIIELIERHTIANTSSKEIARDWLIGEGIYSAKGELTVEFGGGAKAAKAED